MKSTQIRERTACSLTQAQILELFSWQSMVKEMIGTAAMLFPQLKQVKGLEGLGNMGKNLARRGCGE